MAFPQVAATGTAQNNTGTTNHVVNMPAGIAVGNELIAYICHTSITSDTPANAGWTNIYAGTFPGNTGSVYAFRRIADGTEGASQTFTTSSNRNSSTSCDRITGSNTAIAPQSGGNTSGTSINPDALTFTPSSATGDILWIALCGYNNGTTSVSTYPTNYVNGRNVRNNNSAWEGMGIAYQELNAASEDAGSFTISGSTAWRACTIAVAPAAAAGGVVGPLMRSKLADRSILLGRLVG